MRSESGETLHVVVVGAGPAGLTAAYELARYGIACDVLEADDQVGGISRTVKRDGWYFDLGGHRFFTKVRRVNDFWHEILSDDDFLMRPRMSRIYYNSKYFEYPLRAVNALRSLGFVEALACVGSYAKARARPPKDTTNFEGWVVSRFGWRLYRTFFKTYTEKVWGVPAHEIQADWAAQRIKNLSLGKAVVNALLPKGRNSTEVTSLIEQFQYPKYGPGMMWEECAAKAQALGQRIHLHSPVIVVRRGADGRIITETTRGDSFECDHLISSMPINALIEVLDPPAAPEVLQAARRLRHRDFLTVALVVPQKYSFPDNWIYIHSPEVQVGRIQNFGSWSPHLIKDDRTCLGLEYFVSDGDDLWAADDTDLVDLAAGELQTLGIVPTEAVEVGFVVRVPKAYPVYDGEYSVALATIRDYLSREWPQIHPVGRNGMHRYNNQDHSMLTAMLTADNIGNGEQNDVWIVNVDDDYHEESANLDKTLGATGEATPVLPSMHNKGGPFGQREGRL